MTLKTFFLLAPLMMLSIKPLSSIYEISIQTAEGSSINLSSYSGKKLVVIEFNPDNYDSAQLRMLDTLQRSNASLQIIAVPTKDFGSSASAESIQNIKETLNLSFILTLPAFVKKASGADQQELFKWLTHVDQNDHFDNEVDNAGQFYLISGSGNLYTVMVIAPDASIIKQTIEQ
jgi:glutathione peroxidase